MLMCKLLGIFVCLCLKILNIACEDGSTLVFAIDDTGSMRDDIKQVKKQAQSILDVVLTEKKSQIKDFVLVTINDPESEVVLRIKTNSTAIFQEKLKSIRVHNKNNEDCEEMSLTGIHQSLLYSRPNSYIYVFTDASAKDYSKAELIKTLCQRKQSQVVFILTGDCKLSSSRKYTVYYEIAATCGGEVFSVDKNEVDDVLETIKILLRGKTSAIKWKMIPKPTTSFVPISFYIDEKADYAIVSTSGKDVLLLITTTNHLYGPKPRMENITWIQNSKVVGIIDPKPGTYYAWVKGKSAVSITIYARTDFTFEHGFSVLLPKSRKDTSKQPIAGARQHLTINVTDPEHSVNIQSAQILDFNDNGRVIMELPLRKIDDNIYVTNPFVSPIYTFRIAVTGKTKKTCKPIKRISTTAIEPYVPIVVIPESVPKVKIDNENVDVNYDSPITLTCRVRAHPKPEITWFTSSNVSLPSQSALVEDTTYVSFLKLNNIKQSETYTCKAINKQGVDQKEVRANVLPIFTPVSVPAKITPAKYEEITTIPCNITSYLPITIRWYKFEKELKNSSAYSISSDGSALTLKSMDFGMDGPYTCEAILNSDHTVQQAYNTDVELTGLELPVIEPSNNKVHIKKKDKLELKCKIVKGQPKPRVRWFKKHDGLFIPQRDVTGEVLSVAKATFDHVGQYICIADNFKGNASAEFDVTMSSLPEITISERNRTFSYGSKVQFSCKVESLLPVTVLWMDNKGTKLEDKITQISEYEFENKLNLRNVRKDGIYVCVANNKEGSVTEHVNITVPSPFIIKEHIEGDLGIQYGSEKILRCDIISTILMKIQWYRQTAGVKSTRSQIRSNDKYNISDDGMELKINFMDSDMDGKYTCEASLLSQPEEKIDFNVNINTFGLSGPEIIYATTILYEKNFTAVCRVKGVPMPTISWEFQPKGSKEFVSVPGSSEELNIPEIKLKDSGVYKCVVKNRLGEIDRELNLVVKEAPVITFDKQFYYGVEGDLSLKIPCTVTGFPEPIVTWSKNNFELNIKKDDLKYAITDNALIIKNPVKSDSANFTCRAVNVLGLYVRTVYTNITVVFPESVPKVKIDNENEDVNYDSPITLTCRVRAHPKPEITWFTSSNVSLPSQSALVEDTTYVSYLKLNNIKQSETYTCKAINKQGVDQKEVRTNVLPIFTPVSVPAKITPAKYEEITTIPCNITSYLPITIRWYKFEKELKNSSVYSISSDGSALTLKSMDSGMDGPYTCEAILNSDPTVKQAYNTDVEITGLELPVIEPSNNKVHIKKRDKLELKCKIVKGQPKPRLRWYKKHDRFMPLYDVTGEVLSVANATFDHVGQYACVAENSKGRASAKFNVTMSSLPEITISERNRTFSYGSDVQFSCKVESLLPVTIVWKDNKGTKLEDKIRRIPEYKFENKLNLRNVRKDGIYVCVANNTEGSVTEHVNITVPSPFIIKEHIEGDLGIQYGSEKILRCDIISTILMKIQWYRQTADVRSTRSQIRSNDKYNISDDGKELKINFMDSDMDGKYTCEASLLSEPEEKIDFNVNINTVGLTGPEITNSTTIVDKKNFTAICRVKGVPMPTISWEFQPKGSKEFVSVPGSGEELNIPEIKLKDSGAYKCVVKNRLGEINRELNLVVKEAPVITFDKTFYFGIEGDLSLKIPCNVTGFPEPIVVWRKNDLELNIEKDDPKYVIKDNALIIKYPVKSDSANFTCEARNELGLSRRRFYTTITEEFPNDENFYGDTHKIYALQETTVNIKCNVANSDEKSVRWYMNGIKKNQTGNVYIIEKASIFEDANYTCRVDTNEGTKAENYLLDVGYAPTFDDSGSTLKNISWVEEEKLDCRFNSKPYSNVVWFHNGIKMEGETSPLHYLTDWGEYTCDVSNVHKSIQRTYRVTSPGCYLTKDMGTQNKPLILSNVDKPIWPFLLSNSDILLKENEQIKFSCPSDKNSTNVFQKIPSKKETIATCNKHDNFTVDGKTYRYLELQCKTKVEPIVLNKHEQCLGLDSDMIQVGFSVDKFLEIYKICFDKKLKVPLFGTTSDNWVKVNNGPKPSEFVWSPALGLDDGKPTGGYTCKSDNYYCCYAKEQLLNFNELPFGPVQMAMFKENLNSISVWTPCANSNRTSWQKFEKNLWDMSSFYETWFSWTGASDYAIRNGGLVPRYLWKVMTYDGESSVMVYVNDESPVPSDIRCKETCEPITELSDTYLYCCTVEEFTKAFGIPGDKLIASY